MGGCWPGLRNMWLVRARKEREISLPRINTVPRRYLPCILSHIFVPSTMDFQSFERKDVSYGKRVPKRRELRGFTFSKLQVSISDAKKGGGILIYLSKRDDGTTFHSKPSLILLKPPTNTNSSRFVDTLRSPVCLRSGRCQAFSLSKSVRLAHSSPEYPNPRDYVTR